MSEFTKSLEQETVFSSDDMKIRSISIRKISPDENQVRKDFDEEKLGELADSIKEHGIQNPIHVIQTGENAYTILTGERRYRAAKTCGLEMIPCIVHTEEMTETKKKALQLIENLQRQDLSAIEVAKGFDALKQSGMGQREIARHLGISEATVSKGVTILKLPQNWLASIEQNYKKASIEELYGIAKEKSQAKKANLYQKLMELAGKKVEIEIEEAPKKRKNAVKTEFTPEQFDVIWENIKNVVKRDKTKLALYITPAKLQSLLDASEQHEPAEE
jgi:ParB family chromosome partitioning protein